MAESDRFVDWTAETVGAQAAPVDISLWRAVEAQHVVATRRLVDTLDEQNLLEQLLEESKPPAREINDRLHWLLFTPFRYPPIAGGSRFRSPNDGGVWYGADHVRTCCAELGYWRWRLLIASPSLSMIEAIPQTVFQARIQTTAIDLRQQPFTADRPSWLDRNDYAACQALARNARAANVGMIRYESVRDPEHGGCGAVLQTRAFADLAPVASETWMLSVTRERVTWTSTAIVDAGQFEFVPER